MKSFIIFRVFTPLNRDILSRFLDRLSLLRPKETALRARLGGGLGVHGRHNHGMRQEHPSSTQLPPHPAGRFSDDPQLDELLEAPLHRAQAANFLSGFGSPDFVLAGEEEVMPAGQPNDVLDDR